MASVWLEAEAFDNLGGWIIDQQSMRQMGSAYVMAHGIGIPVADAVTTCEIPESGRWTVWARTRDWTACWKRGTAAGRFQVKINGASLPKILGTNGVAWSWQKAGTVELSQGSAQIALHDLTGFNTRCDALLLTTTDEIPSNDPDEVAELRRTVANVVCEDDPVDYDLLVAGGGMAGTCAAIAAIRSGAKVILVQDRPVLGGCNSSEIRVPLGGVTHVPPYTNIGNVVREIAPIWGAPGIHPAQCYEDDRKELVFKLHPVDSYTLALNESVVAVEKDPCDQQKIVAVITRHIRTGAEKRYCAKVYADCTGDAVLARMMGAETMYGRESRDEYGESLAPVKGDNQVMGMSVQWQSHQAAEPTAFPDVDWGIEFNEDNAYYIRSGDWECETGQYRNHAEEAELIRDYGLMTAFANWSFLKNHSKRKDEWANDTLEWVACYGGKRESCRVVGDYVLNQKDIEDDVTYPDATASITWNIDLHFPDPENVAKFDEPFRSCAYHRGLVKPYPVPYRCLYARDVKNLFLGGRHISLSHVTFAAARVMRTLGMLGEVVGMAAAICTKHGVNPRDVYERYLDELKEMMSAGVPINTYHRGDGEAESFHFKELGHVGIYPHPNETHLNDPNTIGRIKALNITVKHFYPTIG